MEEHDPRAILATFAEALADLLQDADLVRAGPEEISITPELAMKMDRYRQTHDVPFRNSTQSKAT